MNSLFFFTFLPFLVYLWISTSGFAVAWAPFEMYLSFYPVQQFLPSITFSLPVEWEVDVHII